MAMYKMGMSMGSDFDITEKTKHPLKQLKKLIAKLDNVLTMDVGEIETVIKNIYSKKQHFGKLSLPEQADLSSKLANIFNDTKNWNQKKTLDDTSGRFNTGNQSNKKNVTKTTVSSKKKKQLYKETTDNTGVGDSKKALIVGEEKMEINVDLKSKITDMITSLNKLRDNKIRNLLFSAKVLSATYINGKDTVTVKISKDGNSLSIQKTVHDEKRARLHSILSGEEKMKHTSKKQKKITIEFKGGEMILKIGGEKTHLGLDEINIIQESIEKAKKANANKMRNLTLKNDELIDPTKDRPENIA